MSHILQVPVPFFFEGAPRVSGGPVGIDAGGTLPGYVTDFLAASDGLALT